MDKEVKIVVTDDAKKVINEIIIGCIGVVIKTLLKDKELPI